MRTLANVSLTLLCSLLLSCHRTVDAPKVVVLGIDGMDPEILRGLMEAGKMPNFAALAAEGSFVKLGTSMPPQSPVAWSNMITGMDPGGHGVFDFVHRDPKTYKPKSSAADTDPIGHSLTLGKYVIPLTGGASHNTRQGDAFWQVLDAHRVPSAVYRMPANFPPVASKSTTLSGMGTPDLMMGYGTYQVYTERPIGDYLSGGILHVVTFREGGRAQSVLNGPDNTYLKTPQATTVPITIFRDEQNPLVKVELADSTVLLKEGEWSDWVPVTFEMIPHLGSARGVCRMYLKRCRPDLVLYVSPINIDPLDPATPISTPDDACEDVAMAIGRYYTKGMPEETKALQDGVFDDEDFVRQGNLVIEESKKMLAHALDHYQSGLLFFYFSSIDLNCHMMWRHCDPSHPAHDPKLAKRYASRIEDLYVEMDHIVGEVRRRLPPDATLIIMSDHGFASFGREMNLNTWLARQGYLVLKDGADPTDAVVADTADWKRSKAYSVGFNGIYLNVAGREANGIVSQAERHALADEIRTKLLAEKDPKTGERFIPSVNLATEIYHGDHVNDAPDILVGFGRGYGASDGSCLGQLSENILEDHNSAWSGNHLMAADLVPGILLSNRKIVKQDPVLQDITVTILKLFGIDKEPKMTGQSVLGPST